MPLIRTDLEPYSTANINEWVAGHGGGRAFPTSFTALGWRQGNRTVGGLVFYASNKKNVYVNIALVPGWNPVGLISAGFRYVEQLGVRRLTFFISSTNLRSVRFVIGLGATHEATLREAEPDGDLHIYALFPENCPIWRKCREKRRSATSPELQ